MSTAEDTGERGDLTVFRQALLRLSTAIAGYTTLDSLCAALATHLKDALPFDHLGLVLVDQETSAVRIAVIEPSNIGPVPPIPGPIDDLPAGRAWRLQRPVVWRLTGDGALPGMQPWLRDLGFRVMCHVPLTTARQRLGLLVFASRQIDDYAPAFVAMMEEATAHVAVAVEHALYLERLAALGATLAAERDRVQLLLRATSAMCSELDLRALLAVISRELRDIVKHHYASITLWDESANRLRREALVSRGGTKLLEAGALVRDGASLPKFAFDRGETIVFSYHDIESTDAEAARVMIAEGFRSACSVPLRTPRGKYGTFNVASPEEDAFTPAEVQLLEQIAAQMAMAIENAITFERLAALKDKLAQEKLYLEAEITQQHNFTEIIGGSAALRDVLAQIETVAATDATVLLLGETGTGKELLARAIHDRSARHGQTFVRLNGAALPAGLLESELFGYEKGAFTGAAATKIGRLELAHRGTLFLDEVGDMPLDIQPKLLRALQEREFERLGGTRVQRVDVRFVAATNRDLAAMVSEGTFREDLFYRLNVFPIVIPPLRERPEDIPALVRHFAAQFSRRMGRTITTIPAATMQTLQRWEWPGNVRELENVIERAVILSRGSVLQVPLPAIKSTRKERSTAAPSAPTFRDGERDIILEALRASNGVVAGAGGAAARLGLKRTTLQSKMRKLGIGRPGF